MVYAMAHIHFRHSDTVKVVELIWLRQSRCRARARNLGSTIENKVHTYIYIYTCMCESI